MISVGVVKALTSHTTKLKVFEIPEGIFRGILYPTVRTKVFQAWIIHNKKEHFFDIDAPEGFENYEKEVTENWTIKNKGKEENHTIFAVEGNDSNIVLELKLPIKTRQYSFRVLKNITGQYLLIFMDISETISDKGLLGFIIIDKL